MNAYFYEGGWTDGLPIVPPTSERVEYLLAGWPGEPDVEIAEVPPLMGVATVRAIAVNAVMAGCAPEYLPVVVAAVSAITRPRYGLSHRQTTTHPATALIIVNGPIARRLKINSGSGLFGPGWRANATIGRALRLCLINLGGAIPGEVDRAQHAHPGKYTYCIAENEDANPWEPYHVERGFARDESTVTLMCGESPHCITDNYNTDPHALLFGYADSMATLGGNNLSSQGEPVLVMAPEHAAYIAAGGLEQGGREALSLREGEKALEARGRSRKIERPHLSRLGGQNEPRSIRSHPHPRGRPHPHRRRRRGTEIHVDSHPGRADAERYRENPGVGESLWSCKSGCRNTCTDVFCRIQLDNDRGSSNRSICLMVREASG